MWRSFGLSLLWGSFSFITYYLLFHYHDQEQDVIALSFYFIHTTLTLSFYLLILIMPLDYIYRRPALRVYSIYQVVENITWLIVTMLLYYDVEFGYCVQLVSSIMMQGLLQSFFVYYALIEDSNVSTLYC